MLALMLSAGFGSSTYAIPVATPVTGSASDITENTAVVKGSIPVDHQDLVDEAGFYYWAYNGTDPLPTSPPNGAEKVVGQFNGDLRNFSATLPSSVLQKNTNYAYMAYFIADVANSPQQKTYGNTQTFMTKWYYAYALQPDSLDDIPNGTTFEQLKTLLPKGLPSTVKVLIPPGGDLYDMPVEWDSLDYVTPDYYSYPTGWTYMDLGGYKSLKGKILPNPNYPNITFDPNNPDREYTSISINMKHPNLLSLSSYTQSYTLPIGTTLSNVKDRLPENLTGSFSNNKTADLPIKWDGATPEFDGTKAGTYTFKGELGCLIEELSFAAPKKLYGAGDTIGTRNFTDCGYENPNDIIPTVTVTIGQSTPPVTTPVESPPVATPPAAPNRTVQVVVANTLGGQTVSEPITSLIGTNLALSGTLYNTNGQPVPGVSALTLSPNGTLNIPSSVPPGTYNLTLNVIAPSGERLAGPPAKLTIDAAGNARLDAELIDPYGVITDSRTKRPVPGVKVTLHWADTELNRSKGRVPGEIVKLPELPDFAPNRNLDPQNSNDTGQYGWMVYPEGDYYILGEKDGYLMFDSRKDDAKATFGTDSYIRDGMIHVGQTIVEYSFEIDPSSQDYLAYMRGYPDGLFRPERGVTRAEVATILQRTMVAPLGSDKLTFGDVSASHWAHDAIVLVVTNGWMQGTGGTDFMPDRAITRGEMAQILASIYGWKDTASASTFSDVNGNWAANAITSAVSQGAMSGYSDGTFRPNQPITRSETVTLINLLTKRPAAPEIPMTWSDVTMSNANYGDIMAASVDHTSTMR